MHNDFQKYIKKHREARGRAEFKVAVSVARAKAERDKTRAALELAIDTLVQEGIDPLSEQGVNLLVGYARSKETSQQRGGINSSLDEVDGPRNLDLG